MALEGLLSSRVLGDVNKLALFLRIGFWGLARIMYFMRGYLNSEILQTSILRLLLLHLWAQPYLIRR